MLVAVGLLYILSTVVSVSTDQALITSSSHHDELLFRDVFQSQQVLHNAEQ